MAEETKVLRLWVVDEGHRTALEITVNNRLEVQGMKYAKQTIGVNTLGSLMAEGDKVTARPRPEIARLMKFFTGSDWFDGCKELYQAYLQEIENLEAQARAQGVQCRECDRGAIVDKYLAILINKGV